MRVNESLHCDTFSVCAVIKHIYILQCIWCHQILNQKIEMFVATA